jgi:hypothetical protein
MHAATRRRARYNVTTLRARAIVVVASVALGACGAAGGTGGTPAPAATGERPASAPRALRSPGDAPTASSSSSSAAAPAPASRAKQPDAASLFMLLQGDLVTCYELGRQATPEMTDGKLTLNASIDAHGKATCVIPSDHTGLTQEVEDCMSARFEAHKLPAGAPWSASIPIAVRRGAVQLGERASDAAMIESVETFRMPDAFDTLEALEPELQACMRGLDRQSGVKSMLVGARVGADGRAQCALATSSGPLPATVSECAAGVLRSAKFPPPKRGSGLVLVPIGLVR